MEIKVNGLCKNYEEKPALSDISFHVKEGMYGLLGANGAGKTTLIKYLQVSLKKMQERFFTVAKKYGILTK